MTDRETCKKRFFEKIKVNPDNGCWEWNAGRTGNGYGAMRLYLPKRMQVAAHRVSAYLFLGLDLSNRKDFVCHKCDNPICVKPQHLYIGNSFTNTTDAIKRRRLKHNRGSKHARSKLTEDDVISMKNRMKNGESYIKISKEYCLSEETIRKIKIGENWKHVVV